MSQPTSPLDAYLAEVAKRCEGATPGPWVVTDTDWPEGYHIQAVVGAPSGDLAQLTNIPDARFIAHARTDLPILLTMLQRAREGLDVDSLRRYHDLSFADPPSYHEAVDDLWDCPMCVEKYIDRTQIVLADLDRLAREATGHE